MKSLAVVRDVPPELFREIAKIKGPHIPLYITALVKATYSCHSHYCKYGKARMFIPSDLSSVLGSNKGQVLRAHDIMVAARDLGRKAEVGACSSWVGIVGALDVRLATFIHDKTVGRKTYASLVDIACVFYDELCARFQSVSQFPCPWVAVPLAASATPSGSTNMLSIRELDARGTVNKTALIELGFVVGASVKPKAVSASAAASASAPEAVSASAQEVVAIGDDFVELADQTKLTFKDAVADWEIIVGDLKVVMMPVITRSAVEHVMDLARSTCKIALQAAYDVHVGELSKLEIQLAPRRGVVCLEKLPPKGLKLVPKTGTVTVVEEGSEPKNNALIGITGLKHPISGKKLIGFASTAKMHVPSAADYAADPNNEKCDIAPYWLVGTTFDTSSANLDIGSLTMSISTAPKGSDHTTTTIIVPILTNMKTLQPGTELLVSKAQKRPQGDVEMSQPKAQKKYKGKSKGKGKGKP